jgi:hypothetical protein
MKHLAAPVQVICEGQTTSKKDVRRDVALDPPAGRAWPEKHPEQQ